MKLLDGEVICSKCNGTGKDKNSCYSNNTCTKCLGEGKLDWVSNAMIKKTSYVYNFSTSTYACTPTITEELYDYMAEQLARKIDQEILEDLFKSNEEQKNINNLNKKFGKPIDIQQEILIAIDKLKFDK